jgi:tRNA (guanine-N7-)-methyltransferase
VIELGCGKGEYTVGLAELCPNKNFIGLDIKGSRMWVGCKTALKKNLTNVAFIRRHISGIEHLFAKNEVDEIWITFPDPHLREGTAKRRLTSPEFIARYSKILRPGGIIHLKTDDETLYNYSLSVCKEHHFQIICQSADVYAGNIEGPVTSLQTYYEQMWLDKQLKIKYLAFVPFAGETEAEESFFSKVWQVASKIPHGRVTSYGAIAKYLGSTGSARMVGWAMNASKNAKPEVPAHRVVNRNGMLSGKFHFGGIDAMKQLLQTEGIEVEDDHVKHFDALFWDPTKELE